jgi:hypothetical protein
MQACLPINGFFIVVFFAGVCFFSDSFQNRIPKEVIDDAQIEFSRE